MQLISRKYTNQYEREKESSKHKIENAYMYQGKKLQSQNQMQIDYPPVEGKKPCM